MTSLLLAPSDVLPVRDGSSMPGGEAGRLPLPRTLQEAFRRALSSLRGDVPGNDDALHLRGPLPWQPGQGHLFPVPLDASRTADGIRRHRLLLLPSREMSHSPDIFAPPCLPAAEVPQDREEAFIGWWNAAQLSHYLAGSTRFDASPVPTRALWLQEPEVEGGLGAVRLIRGTRLAIQTGLVKPSSEERAEFDALLRRGQMPLGDDCVAQFERKNATWPAFPKPEPAPGDGPWHVRWILLTPAFFRHGSLPGWCRSSPAEQSLPDGQVCLRERKNGPFLPAHLVAHHLGRPVPVKGWDDGSGCPKPTQLAVPAGSVYHFLCADAACAGRLVTLLHDRPRSDFFAESGCGHGLCAQPEPLSADLRPFAARLCTP